MVLLLAEFLPPESEEAPERRHIVSVFKLVQELLVPSTATKGKNGFQMLMDLLPADHKARWMAGAALTAADQSMASVMSTVLSRLNAFLDTELEQIICFDSSIDAETFASQKCAIFLILPEEDATKNFMAGLMIQNLSRELFAVADEHGGQLQNRVAFFCDELGTMPPFDILPLFSAGRSRRLSLVPIIQSLAQLEKNYGKVVYEYLYRQINDKKVRETIDFLLNREEAHNQMFRDAFNSVQDGGSNQDFGTTKAARMYFSMSNPGPNAFAGNDVQAPRFDS